MASKLLKISPALINLAKNGSLYQVSARCKATAAAIDYEQALKNTPPTKLTVLDNGIRVASEDGDAPTTSIGVWIEAGARYESPKSNGAGNFVEHLLFKGTGKRSQHELEKELDKIGAQLSAETSRENTVITAKCLSSDVGKALEILGDVLENVKLADEDIERQRGVVLREVQELDSNLREVVMDYLHATAFQGTPLAQTVQGPTKNIKSFTRQDLVDYVKANFRGSRVVLSAAGGVQHEQLVKLAEQHLGSVSNKYEGKAPPTLEHCRFTGSEIRDRDDAIPFAHVAIAVEGCGWTDPDNVPLNVAKAIIGSWSRFYGGGANHASFLAQSAAQLKLCQSFESFNLSYKDTGLWGTYFVCDPLKIEDTMFNLQNEWMRLCSAVTESEVERARNAVRTSLLAQLDGPSRVSADIGSQILAHGRRIPLHELVARIDSVSAADVREVCNKYIYDRCPAVVGVGPVENLPDYNRVRSSMYWLRV